MPPFQPQRFGSYILTAHLGRGGMADVFRAQRTGAAGFERTVVVKRILPPYNDDPAFVQMFINEAKIAAELSHPNIAQVHELGEVEGEYFMALEYVKGQDLLHVLRFLAKNPPEKRALPPDVSAYIAREISRGLAHAHDHQDERGNPRPIVHRDVSPQNIMLGYDGQVKIVDFGIAKAMHSVREETRTGALKGKIAYMSPEQVTGTNPGPESDVFSAGVVLYEMLIGRRLFKGQNDFDTLTRVKSMPIPAPSRVANWVPPQLDAVVMRALERDRQNRYKRAGNMARDLDEYLQSARFSLEQMSDYMNDLFPLDKREEVPDGQSARIPELSTPSSPSAGSSSSSRSSSAPAPHNLTNPGTPRAIASSGSRSGVVPPRESRRVLFGAVIVALAIGFGGALLALKPAAKQEESAPPQVVVTPTHRPTVEALDMATPAAAVEPAKPEEPIAPEVHKQHASQKASAKPHTTEKPKHPNVKAFEDEDTPATKVQTFDD